ncbi:MAG: ABC transporter permease [Lachnospiraceae bacterium]|nr:ABC transporter permease [Lachnospiraceae bacterium]
MLTKVIFRTIKKSLGRYFAILSIIALGVGFFVGLRVTEEAMRSTADKYLDELNLYDYRLVSTWGITAEDEKAFKGIYGSENVSGSVSSDVIICNDNGSDNVFHAHTLLDGINGVDIKVGRKPEKVNECLLDGLYFDENMIGKKLVLSSNNSDSISELFSYKEYEIVGICNSSEYINFQRGTTSLAGGKVAGFIYIPEEGFNSEYYTELFIKLPVHKQIYSEDYDGMIDSVKEGIERLFEERSELRYKEIYDEAYEKIKDARAEVELKKDELESKKAELQAFVMNFPGFTPDSTVLEMLENAEKAIKEAEDEIDEAELELSEIEFPTTFVLDRKSTNLGYLSFKNDIQIVSGVAKVFPLFFFLVAALVCITTMTRMVGEMRTQNGVLKALGYSNFAVASQYLIYAGSASLVGCFVGFVLGSKLMPLALWQVYHIMYAINRPIEYVLDWYLFGSCAVIYMIAMQGITWLVCRKDLQTSSAGLMRPVSPSAGKRILLERIGFIWKNMKFLHKVSVRNILRYKKRMFMMIIGIGGCTALLLTGFGIRDTIQPILDYQYGEISLYDAAVSFLESPDAAMQKQFVKDAKKFSSDVILFNSCDADVVMPDLTKSVNVIVYRDDMSPFINLHRGKTEIEWPGLGEIVINYDTANKLDIKAGDEIVLRDSDFNEMTVTVSGIYDNYIGEIIYMSEATWKFGTGSSPQINSAYLIFEEGVDEYEASAQVLNLDNVMSVQVINLQKSTVAGMLDSLDYIVLIVLVGAGMLSFVVLFNLTNITITERAREIATLKVLGFHRKEQNAYIFRENVILTIISAICGIPMGIALLRYVMQQIKIDGFYFGCRLATISYVYSFALTLLFTIIVDLTLTKKLRKINMAEAMKAIE